jgi:glycosyltransferase involved in cell wall biosynthesis
MYSGFVKRRETNASDGTYPVRVALLTNILPNYRVALLERLQSMVSELQIFLSARTESNREAPVSWGSLDVCVQRSISWSRRFVNVHGFEDVTHTHIPIDTYWQLSRFKPDVIISGEFGARSIFAVLYRTFNKRSRVILWATLSQRTESTRGGLRNAVRHFLLRRVDHVFVNGADGEGYIRKMGFRGSVTAIPYVVENAAFATGSSSHLSSDTVTMFYAGQLIERKGLLAFYEALRFWSEANRDVQLELRIAGTGPLLPHLQAAALESSVPTAFLGHLGVDGLSREYGRASIYVFPTYADEWGVVVNAIARQSMS